jgi:large subunit ribosomal protein L22
MEYKSTQKYLIMSPRKIRLVVELVKKMKPSEAVEKLAFVQKRAAESLGKVIKSALANAKNQGVSETDLVFKEIQIGEGPRLKRGRAASRGRWHQFKRRMSHIRVVLTTTKSQEPSSKLQPKPEPKLKEPKIEKTEVKTKKGEAK